MVDRAALRGLVPVDHRSLTFAGARALGLRRRHDPKAVQVDPE